MSFRSLLVASVLAVSSMLASSASAQFIRDSFTYQGNLSDSGAPADGLYDITFLVFEDENGGSPILNGTVTNTNVEVIDGLFSTEVEFAAFGSIFNTNTSRYLELRISESGQPGVTILEPRQKLVPATLANYALRAGFAQNSGTSLNGAYQNDNTILFQEAFGPLNLVATTAESPVINMRTNLGDDRVKIGFDDFAGDSFFELYGPDGFQFFTAERDASTGGGGFVAVPRNDSGASGIFLDGNYFGTQSPRIAMFGTAGTILLEPGQAGNGSVVLPSNAISSTEILNEVGAAEVASTTVVNLTDDGSTIDTINSVTINAPADGFVLVLANAEVEVDHINGSSSTATFGVSDSAGLFESNTDLEVRLPSTAATGQYDYPVSSHAIFQVSQGSNTFYFVGRDGTSGGATFTVFDRQLSAIYIPSSYGTLGINAAPNIPDGYSQSVPPMNAYDILAEQNAALQADNDRQQRELDEMRAMMEQIKREMQREQSQQRSRD
ncbi:MAG: hypothetical protein JJ974_07080 [Phycisphaerales bacterium]|nr:hypothetical protein [Phycisphaerales bacterium]